MKSWAKVFAVLFGLPIFAVLFFGAAPKYIDWQLHDAIHDQIAKSETSPENKAAIIKDLDGVRFDQACREVGTPDAQLVTQMGIESTCFEFQLFHYAQIFAAALILIALLHIAFAYIVSRLATKSREALKANFGLGWKVAIGFSLTILLGQTLLGGVSLYYLTVVLMHRYFPQLILGLVIGGFFAFYNVIKMLLSKIPLGWHEPTSEEVAEAAGADLWKSIRELAQRMGISPPDTVLVGLSTGFYVTEAPVTHASGVSRGRTLHLSAPMMKQLSKDEVLAIVGHELGHFKGADTVFSTEINPMLIRAERSTELMAQGGLFGWPASQAMNVFNYFFKNVISAQRRERELIADSEGAAVTSPKTFAQALIRYVFHSEAYETAFTNHLRDRSALEATLAASQDELRKDENFWTNASTLALTHPFDSHPPLGLRIEKLGFKIADFRDHASSAISVSGFDALLHGKNEILEHAQEFQANAIKENQERLSIQLTKAEDLPLDVIRDHFPQVVFQNRAMALYIILFIESIVAIGCLIALFAGDADKLIGKVICVFVLAVLAWFARDRWRALKDVRLTLNHMGIQLSTWKQMLKFEDVTKISPFNNNGNLQLSFAFKEKRLPIQKHPWFKNLKRKGIQISMSSFQGDQAKNATEILRYFLKEKRS